jgi:hypothetical protein
VYVLGAVVGTNALLTHRVSPEISECELKLIVTLTEVPKARPLANVSANVSKAASRMAVVIRCFVAVVWFAISLPTYILDVGADLSNSRLVLYRRMGRPSGD